jgi:hypothetical protein
MLNYWGGVLEGGAFSVGHDHRQCANYIIPLMRSDWTQNAITFAKGIKTAKVQGKRWKAAAI